MRSVGAPCRAPTRQSPGGIGPDLNPGTRLALEADQPLFGELADRIGRALARIARVLDPSVGHLVGPEGRDLVDHHATELEDLAGLLRVADVSREDPGLKAIARVVRHLERLVEAPEGVDR